MEVYILDSTFRETSGIVDKFETLIWTERFAAWGDFQIDIRYTPENSALLAIGKRLAIKESKRVMTIETREKKMVDGKDMLIVKGRSLEYVLDDRIATLSLSDTTAATNHTWYISQAPAQAAYTMYLAHCVTGQITADDIVPYAQNDSVGSAYIVGNIPPPPYISKLVQERVSLYAAIKALCDAHDMGFRFIRNYVAGASAATLHFHMLMGDDRTSGQTVLEPLVFDESLGTLANVTELETVEAVKNIAYVTSPRGNEQVYAPYTGTMPFVGLNRRVMHVKAELPDDLAAADVTAELQRIGKLELGKLRGMKSMDGAINPNRPPVYGIDYNLGDLVDLRNKDGVLAQRRISEQIFVKDREGKRSYPTLTER